MWVLFNGNILLEPFMTLVFFTTNMENEQFDELLLINYKEIEELNLFKPYFILNLSLVWWKLCFSMFIAISQWQIQVGIFVMIWYCFLLFWDVKKGNVANQREHLILLLANLNIRDRAESSSQVNYYFPHKNFVFLSFLYLMGRLMLNFRVITTFPILIVKANTKLTAASCRNCRKVDGNNFQKLWVMVSLCALWIQS